MSSLLLAHVVQASTGTFSINWLRHGSAICGHQCDAQGLIETIGDPAVAMSTLAIAVHIFLCVFFSWRPPASLRYPTAVVGFIWAYFLIHAGVSKATHRSISRPLITPTPYWCWISGWYQRERLTAAYMWYWTTAAACTVIYVVLFLYIRGNVELARGRRFSISLHKAPEPIARTGSRFSLTSHSRKMLIYPAAYIAIILPQSLIRWMTAAGITVDPLWVFFSQCIFSLGGLCDALLLIFTRPHVLGFESSQSESRKTIEISMVVSTHCDWDSPALQSTNSATVLTTAAAMEGRELDDLEAHSCCETSSPVSPGAGTLQQHAV
ncbi:hypothetical protein AURDEDRAFT_109625 [Auricularia subglabra TFB-10046 SS5]|nr:hypothetical protein AURDEDRAFT_109625 [Auricularia subglabra TFB-10046 SS5]